MDPLAPPLTPADVAINPRESGLQPLDFRAVFGNDHPVVLEVGSGKGRFLLRHAAERPHLNFLGIEYSLHYHRVIVDRLVKHGVRNVRAVNYDAFLVIQKMIPDASLSEIHIYFPDPWPRPREQKRRIIRPAVVAELARVLAPGGTGWYVTDHREYFEKAAPLLADGFATEAGEIVHDPPRTNYEAKYQAEGRPIYQVLFRHK